MPTKSPTQPFPSWARNLLWIDGSAGLTVGVLILSLRGWLIGFYSLPGNLLLVIGLANVLYGCYSLSLARRPQRAMSFIWFLVAANGAWAVVCLVLGVTYFESATLFGLLQLFGESVFVGGLAIMEWRWREMLGTSKLVDGES